MLEVARKKYKHISNLDFENEVIKEKYNKIVLYFMFLHIENKTKIIKTLVKKNLSKKYQYLLNT